MNKRQRQQRARIARRGENRSVDYLTVGWMLMVITTLICEAVAAASHMYVMQFDRQARFIDILARLLLFAAFIVGTLSLIVCPVVLKSRREPPPHSVLFFAVIIGAAPLLTLLLQSLR